MTNKRKSDEVKRESCDNLLMQFFSVKTIASALQMSRGTISERAKRMGLSRHYITDAELRLLHKRRIGGGAK